VKDKIILKSKIQPIKLFLCFFFLIIGFCTLYATEDYKHIDLNNYYGISILFFYTFSISLLDILIKKSIVFTKNEILLRNFMKKKIVEIKYKDINYYTFWCTKDRYKGSGDIQNIAIVFNENKSIKLDDKNIGNLYEIEQQLIYENIQCKKDNLKNVERIKLDNKLDFTFYVIVSLFVLFLFIIF